MFRCPCSHGAHSFAPVVCTSSRVWPILVWCKLYSVSGPPCFLSFPRTPWCLADIPLRCLFLALFLSFFLFFFFTPTCYLLIAPPRNPISLQSLVGASLISLSPCISYTRVFQRETLSHPDQQQKIASLSLTIRFMYMLIYRVGLWVVVSTSHAVQQMVHSGANGPVDFEIAVSRPEVH